MVAKRSPKPQEKVRFLWTPLDFGYLLWYNTSTVQFGKEKEIEIFKKLASKSALQVGLDYGFEKVYKDKRAIRNAVTAIYNKVKNNSEEYGLTPDTVSLVETSMANRRVAPTKPEPQGDDKNIKERVVSIRDKTFELIDRKLDRVSASKKKLDAISFKDLGTLAGIAFDKGQILKGEATEHIAVAAKIDKNITAEEAIEMALKSRESNVDYHNRKS